MSVKVINLEDNVEQTEELNMPNNLSPTPDYNVYLGYAQTSFPNVLTYFRLKTVLRKGAFSSKRGAGMAVVNNEGRESIQKEQ